MRRSVSKLLCYHAAVFANIGSFKNVLLSSWVEANDLIVRRCLSIWVLDIVAFSFCFELACELKCNMDWSISILTLKNDNLLRSFPAFAWVTSTPNRWFGFRNLLVASSTGNLTFEALHVPIDYERSNTIEVTGALHVGLPTILRYP